MNKNEIKIVSNKIKCIKCGRQITNFYAVCGNNIKNIPSVFYINYYNQEFADNDSKVTIHDFNNHCGDCYTINMKICLNTIKNMKD